MKEQNRFVLVSGRVLQGECRVEVKDVGGHTAVTASNEADARTILTASPPDNWKRPPGRPRITWFQTI